MAEFKDYYDILGVAKDAGQEEIKRAYRKLAVKHHPDRNPDDAEAENRFKELNEAYTALSDPEKRKVYDTYGRDGGIPPQGPFAGGGAPGGGRTVYTRVGPEEFADFSDFFQSLFGGGFQTGSGGFPPGGGGFVTGGTGGRGEDPFGRMGAHGRTAPPPGARAELSLDLLRAYAGGQVPITVAGRRVTVTVPPGVRDGAKLRLRGQAPDGGDLILVVRHEPHPDLALDGDDVHAVVRVPDHVAALGGKALVPTLTGPAEVTIPAGSSGGRVLRLRGQGWPRKGGDRGDQRIEIRVTVPAQPSPRQIELYRALRNLEEAPGSEAETEPV